MSYNPSSPVTGAAQTGLTSPTYTLTADAPPNNFAEQYAVSALGGTQTGVNVHSISSPFTQTMFRPGSFKSAPLVNPVTGQVQKVQYNSFRLITRKGCLPVAGAGVYWPVRVTTTYEIPAGVDIADVPNLRAALSLHHGVEWALSSAIGDTLITGTL
jgi:hypothetical protein